MSTRITKLEQCANVVNNAFSEKLNAAFKAKFGIALTTGANLFSMTLVSQREDDEDFTPEQRDWIAAYSDGYAAALKLVRYEANKRYFAQTKEGEQ
jgi:L-cystine uptake protein TcyP (sodium:dicarboxylate symporter family)